MDDLIVIILMLIFSVIGGLSQLKKKKEKNQKDKAFAEPANEPDFWDELATNPFVEKLIPEEKQEPVQPEKKEVKDKSPETLFKEGTSDIFSPSVSNPDFIKITEIGKKKKRTSFLKDFTLRKAVIYSEILNRKYF